MKPRLLFISNLFPDRAEPYRGLDNVTLLHHLRSYWDIRVLSPRPSLKAWTTRQGDFMARAEDAELRPEFVPAPYVPKFGSRWNHWLMARALRPALAARRNESSWDITLGAWLYPDGCALVRSCNGTPAALIAQGTDVHQYLHEPTRRQLILDAVGKAAVVFTRSISLRTALTAAGANGQRIHPLHNGVDTACFCLRDQAEARRELGVEPNVRLLLFVGNLLPVKDPHLLLATLAELAGMKSDRPWQLVLAGKGPMRAELEKKTQELGLADRVRFLGPQPAFQVARWMNAADVLCLTSRNEGLPNVVLEAQASGLPVVAANVGGISEVIDADWKGLLCDTRQPCDFAQAIVRAAAESDPPRIAADGARRNWASVAEVCHQNLIGCLPA